MDDSNTIQVTVNTNNAYGYKLSATVGNTNNTSSELRHSSYSTSGDPIFSSLALNANLSKTSFGTGTTYDDKWGYSLNGTAYNGLPVEGSSDEPVTILSSDYMPTGGTANTPFLIGAKASVNKPSGDYTNVVNFYAVANAAPDFLYDKVAEMSKGRLTAARLREAIETPTTNNYTTDTSNSGVYEYDASIFGPSSDVSANNKIYIYRGILENNPATYGSAGSAVTYPNYVRLSNNTCWRIVRTTGSGGVKMIYNGIWSGNTCSNSRGSVIVSYYTQYATQGTSVQSHWYYNIHYVGYTYNNSVTDVTSGKTVDEAFGNNSNISANNTRSNAKIYIEDTWYVDNMMQYTSMLEPSAGYCNDRTLYSDLQNFPTPVTMVNPLGSFSPSYNGVDLYFGASERLKVVSAVPTLGCPRGEVDLYRYVANSQGLGNELKYPVALLTADEAALVGADSTKTYLSAGSLRVLLSPSKRKSMMSGYMFIIGETSGLTESSVDINGISPVISLKSGTIITGGTGIATDPWTVE